MIDKNKAYRFRGDSERWAFAPVAKFLRGKTSGTLIDPITADHLHERGILLEYPELPGEDWEFCDEGDAQHTWCDSGDCWALPIIACPHCQPIYCRKKKPVITEVECVVGTFLYEPCVPLPVDFAGPGDRVKVTKL